MDNSHPVHPVHPKNQSLSTHRNREGLVKRVDTLDTYRLEESVVWCQGLDRNRVRARFFEVTITLVANHFGTISLAAPTDAQLRKANLL